jgi:hypothetical protein
MIWLARTLTLHKYHCVRVFRLYLLNANPNRYNMIGNNAKKVLEIINNVKIFSFHHNVMVKKGLSTKILSLTQLQKCSLKVWAPTPKDLFKL